MSVSTVSGSCVPHATRSARRWRAARNRAYLVRNGSARSCMTRSIRDHCMRRPSDAAYVAASVIVSPRPDLGPRPALGYIASRLERAVTSRGDDSALKQYCEHAQAAGYVVGGELVVLKAGEPCDPLFTPREARVFGHVREVVFLGLADTAPRFGFGLDPEAVEKLKARNDLKISDLRSIAVQGMVEANHLP